MYWNDGVEAGVNFGDVLASGSIVDVSSLAPVR